jgi:hypothetical protein
MSPTLRSGLGGLFSLKKENSGSLGERFGKAFMISANKTNGSNNDEGSNKSGGFKRAPTHIPEEEVRVLREKEDLADMN